MKNKLIVIVLSIVMVLVPFVHASFSAQRLEQLAIYQGFGYKTANLMQLNKACSGMEAVSVPLFHGISSNAVSMLLKKYAQFDIVYNWAFVAAWGKVAMNKGQSQALSSNFLAALATFRADLSASFDRVIKDKHRVDGLPKIIQWSKEVGLEAFLLQFAGQKNTRIMVRSTGREDTETLANAGGNESVANVKPITLKVVKAIKQVVLSYFSEKSLRQRLGQYDTTVFSNTIFVPILLQQMIGEVGKGSIPTSGVLFTQDPEAGMATGVALLQAAFGHGELVVNSLGLVDTWRILNLPTGHAVYPTIRNKVDRLAPDKKNGGLCRVSNSLAIQKEPSLSRVTAERLAVLGFNIQKYYGRPMDIEFVVMPAESKDNLDKIFVVQARPIVFRDLLPDEQPSYCLPQQEGFKGVCRVFTGATIGAAGGSLRVLTACSQVIFAKTIGEALAIYTSAMSKADQIKAIIVGHMAPSTSHEATTFRGEGKPVVCFNDWQEVERQLNSGKKILLDVQQGQVVVMEPTSSHASFMQAGWFSYPAPATLSLESDYFTQPLVPLHKTVLKASDVSAIPSCMKEIKLAAKSPPNLALLTIEMEKAVAALIAVNRSFICADNDLKKKSIILLRAVKQLCMQIRMCVTPESFMQRLLLIQLLEAAIHQNGIDWQECYSVGTLLAGAVTAEKLIVKKNQAYLIPAELESRQLFTQLMKIKNIIMNDELKDSWQKLLENAVLHKDCMRLRELSDLVKGFIDLEILPTWLHTEFLEIVRACATSGAPLLSRVLIRGGNMLNQSSDFLAAVKEKKAALASIPLESFGDPVKFDAAWHMFNRTIIDYVISPAFLQSFKGAGSVAQAVACGFMASVVDVFDLGIKAMKSGPAWQPARFKMMLQRYFVLLSVWANNLVPDISTVCSPARCVHFNTMVNGILQKTAFTNQDRFLTPGLSIYPFTLASPALITYPLWASKPTTGEDIFSVLHQSLLQIIEIVAPYKVAHFALPDVLRKAHNEIFDTFFVNYQHVTPTCISTICSANKIALTYNIPLRDHSAQCVIDFNRKTKKASLSMSFYGGNEESRWQDIFETTLLTYIVQGKPQKITSANISVHVVSFTFELTEATDFPLLKQVLQQAINESFSHKAKMLVDNTFGGKDGVLARHSEIEKCTERLIGVVQQPTYGYIRSLCLENQCDVLNSKMNMGMDVEKAVSFSCDLLRRNVLFSYQKNVLSKIFDLLDKACARGKGLREMRMLIADPSLNASDKNRLKEIFYKHTIGTVSSNHAYGVNVPAYSYNQAVNKPFYQ
jgi:hypothetical protein